jgi:hypothetical protein
MHLELSKYSKIAGIFKNNQLVERPKTRLDLEFLAPKRPENFRRKSRSAGLVRLFQNDCVYVEDELLNLNFRLQPTKLSKI